MRWLSFVLLVSALLFGARSSLQAAEEVIIEYKGLDLVGSLALAPGKSLRGNGVVLMLHDVFSFGQDPLMSALQDRLQAQGVNSLAITLSLGLDRRNAPYECALEHDHRYEDALEEIQAWLVWLAKAGVRNVTLLGQGLGANQMALYLVEQRKLAAEAAKKAKKKTKRRRSKARKGRDVSRLVRRLVLISPQSWNYDTVAFRYREKYGQDLGRLLQKAREMIEADHGDSVLEGADFLSCGAARVTANAFVSYYAPDPRRDLPSLLPDITVPVMVAVGDANPEAADLMMTIQALGAGGALRFEVIDGADVTFSDFGLDQLVERIVSFLQEARLGKRS